MESRNAGLNGPIDGLDVAAGVRRLEGDAELYVELLRDFVDTEKSAAIVTADALDRGDLLSATRRVHTVKGLAGTFCAGRLYPVAEVLETALRGNEAREHLDTKLRAFAAELSALVDALEAALPAEDAPAPLHAGPVDPQQLAAACAELAALLAHSDMRAGRTVETHSAQLRAAFGDADLRRLEQSLRHFEFDEAARILADACHRNGVPLVRR